VLLAVYDIFSKRTAFPPLIDLAQALGWGSFLVFGVGVVSDHLTKLASVPFLFSIIYVMIINSLNSMKDIPNDLSYHVQTTPTFFGVRPTNTGADVPLRFKVYLFVLQGLLCGSILLPLLANWFNYSLKIWAITLGITGIVSLGTFLLLVAILRLLQTFYKALSLGGIYYLSTLILPLVVFFPNLGLEGRIVISAAYAIPVGAFFLTLASWITHKEQEGLS